MCQRAKVTQNWQKIGLNQTEVATNFVYPFFLILIWVWFLKNDFIEKKV